MNKNELLKIAYQSVIPSGLSKDGVSVKKVYNGYIASFGAGIIQSGLLPTLAIYTHDSDNSEESKAPLLKALYAILEKHHAGLPMPAPNGDLFQYALNNSDALPLLQRRLTEGAVALKLALRTFKLL